MSVRSKFFSLLMFFASALLLASCSSSTSSSGNSGQIPTGIYTGVFNGQTAARITTADRAQLSVNVPIDAGVIGTPTGNLAITGTNIPSIGRCFVGGPISAGAVNGNQMNLTIDDGTGGVITMTGRVTDDTYRGTFSATDSRCGAVSGGFEFNRA